MSTETDYFRIAREQLSDFSLCIVRRAALDVKPYYVSLDVRGQMHAAQGSTLTEALDAAFKKHGIRTQQKPEESNGPLFST